MKVYYPLGRGIVGEKTSRTPVLGPQTINFYLDADGYLSSYPGKTDLFDRPAGAHQGSPPSAVEGTPVTRVQSFTDVWGLDHIVFVRGNDLCVMRGNGYKVLYTFSGRKMLGFYLPDLFVFQSKLIVTNFGDPVLVWDGRKGVQPLGVHEAPLPPDPRPGQAPFSANPDHATSPCYNQGYGPFKYRGYWWPGETPANGAGDNKDVDGTSPVKGLYQLVVQFTDEYGNKGPVSAPSAPFDVKSNRAEYANGSGYTDIPTVVNPEFPAYDWTPPQSEAHITGVIIGSTLNLNANGGAGAEGVYYQCLKQAGHTPTRSIQQLAVYQLADSESIDTSVSGPPSCGQGATWGQRICLWDLEDPYRWLWSDVSLFGQFRSTNEYRGQDKARAAVPLGDRVLLVSASTVEILYDNNGLMARLEQQFSFGSHHGRSLLDVGGAVFGLWSRGWGFYDGDQFVAVEAPYFFQGSYVDNQFYAIRACLWGRRYFLSVSLNGGDGPTHLIEYNLDARQWYIYDEQVWDLTIWKGSLLGCATSIYELFKGTYPAATLEIYKLTAMDDSVLVERTIDNIEVFLEPTGVALATCEITGTFLQDGSQTVEGLRLLPAVSAASKNKYPVPYWDPGWSYPQSWSAPGSMLLTVETKSPIKSIAHTLKFDFPAGQPVKLQGLGIDWSAGLGLFPQ